MVSTSANLVLGAKLSDFPVTIYLVSKLFFDFPPTMASDLLQD